MLFNSYLITNQQKRNTIDFLYQKIVDVSRNKVFYTKLKIPDTLDGRYDLLALFSIILIFSLSKSGKKGLELSQVLFDKIFLDLDLSLREMGAGDAGVHIKIKNMIRSYMGRQKVYCESFEEDNFIKLEKSLIRNIYRNSNDYNNEPNLLVKYCIYCIYKFKDKQIEYFISSNFNFPKIDNFFE
ncbi:MAG: hypothetical protein CMM64_03105 [Rhodospirillaceae bacterium]|nr:hypothetical protein [Rhodospirillaceae bacterium]